MAFQTRYLPPLIGSLLVGGAIAAVADGPLRGLAGGPPSAPSSRSSEPQEPPIAPAGGPERALIAPLAEGDSLAGWNVERVGAVMGGTIRLDLRRQGERAALMIALDDGGDPRPPLVVGRYAIFYTAKDSDEGARLAAALGAVIEKNPNTKIPHGLAAFHPGTRL